MVHKPQTDVY